MHPALVHPALVHPGAEPLAACPPPLRQALQPCTEAVPPGPLQEPFNRIKKEMLKEVKGMGPGERVLLLGNSREPWLCTKKDEKVSQGCKAEDTG